MDASLSSGVLEVAVSPDQPNFLECSLDPVHNHDETDVKNKKKHLIHEDCTRLTAKHFHASTAVTLTEQRYATE